MTSFPTTTPVPPLRTDGELRARQESTLKYWKALEMIQGQGLPRGEHGLHDGPSVTWLVEGVHEKYPSLQFDAGVEHHVYVGVVSTRDAFEVVSGAALHDELDGQGRSRMALGIITLMGGRYVRGSFRVSTGKWALSRLRAGQPLPDGYDESCRGVCEEVEELLEGTEVTSATLRVLCELVSTRLGLADLYAGRELRHGVLRKATSDSGLNNYGALNGFYLSDINKTLKLVRSGRLTPALSAYLGGAPSQTTDVGSERGQRECVELMLPYAAAAAAWPTEDSLSASEQLVSNALRQHLEPNGGLQTVCLPHGASGHRIARDLLLEALNHRAAAMAAFPRTRMMFGRTCSHEGVDEGFATVNETLLDCGVAVIQPRNAGIEDLSRQLSARLQVTEERDPLVAALMRKGVLCLDASTRESRSRFVTNQLEGEGGIYELLRAAANKKQPREEELSQWRQACGRYSEAAQAVQTMSEVAEAAPEVIRRVVELRRCIQALLVDLERLKSRRKVHTEKILSAADAELRTIEHEIDRAKEAMSASPRSLYQTVRAFVGRRRGGTEDREAAVRGAEQRFIVRSAQLERDLSTLSDADAVIAKSNRELADAEAALGASIEQLQRVCVEQHLVHLGQWLSTGRIDDPATEFQSPWYQSGLAEARARLFYECVRINAVFMRQQAKRVLGNLQIAQCLLAGGPGRGLISTESPSLWATIHLVAPAAVMNNTNVGSVFRKVKPEGFRWVVQMSAGQISPWRMLSAVTRGRGVVLLGEKNEFLNSLQIPDVLRQQIALAAGMDPAAAVSLISALHVADAASRWRGLAVRSVECSAEPMLSILRAAAYGDYLVPRRVTEGVDGLDSGWIDIRGNANSTWVPNEGRALLRVLDSLWCQGVAHEQVAIVSLSSRVRSEVQKLIPSTSGFHVLTPQALSGRSYSYVILMLGSGSASWRRAMSSNPAILAAPAGASRRGLYVIGDRAEWSRLGVLSVADDYLPRVCVDTVVDLGDEVYRSNGKLLNSVR